MPLISTVSFILLIRAKTILIFLALFLWSSFAFAQTVIKGIVFDNSDKKRIANATLKIGIKQFVTDYNGEFSINVDLTALRLDGISVSSVGYKSKRMHFEKSNFYEISLESKVQNLNEIIIYQSGKTILEKAIRNIPKNYPTKDFMMEGILRITRIFKDTTGVQEFYKNDAVLKIFHPSYLNGKDPEVTLVQNNYSLQQTDKITKPSKWVDAYLAPVANFVYKKSDFVNLKKLKNYNYKINGKTKINNHTAYIIAFNSIKNNTNEIKGLMYIDTATYTFLSANYAIYNANGIDGQPYSKQRIKCSIEIKFKEENQKWFLDRINVKNKYKNDSWDGEITFLTTSIDTVNVKPFAYPDIIQRFTEALTVNNVVDTTWSVHQSIFNKAERQGLLQEIANPIIDIDSNKFFLKENKESTILGYLRNNNMRVMIGLSHLPIHLDSYQPLVDKNISLLTQLAFYSNTQMRIYKHLFGELGGSVNFGLGGLKIEIANYGIAYDFNFNKKGHPIIVFPSFGFQRLLISKKRQIYFKQNSLYFGLTAAYELTHKYSLYSTFYYSHNLNEINDGLLLTTQTIYPTIGVMYKIN